MTRKSITLTRPNDEWIKAKIIKAEQSGFTDLSPGEILALSKAELRKKGWSSKDAKPDRT